MELCPYLVVRRCMGRRSMTRPHPKTPGTLRWSASSPRASRHRLLTLGKCNDMSGNRWALTIPTPARAPFCPRQAYCPEYGLGQYLENRSDDGDTDFNSLQVQVDKKFTHGYQFRAAYTWEQTLSDSWTDPFDREAYKYLGRAAPMAHAEPRGGSAVRPQSLYRRPNEGHHGGAHRRLEIERHLAVSSRGSAKPRHE